MAVVSILLGFLPKVADISTQVPLLSVGLFALALAALQEEEQSGEDILWKTR